MSEAIYVVIRRDLGMRRGKEIAQGVHAVAKLGYVQGLPVIVVQAKSLWDFCDLVQEAHDAGMAQASTQDAGLTEVAPGTFTAAAIGPVTKGRLPLLSAAELY